MGLAICGITNNLLTEGLFAICPARKFFNETMKRDGTKKYVCAVTYPHEHTPCWDIVSKGLI
jgi:hypothetical protein